MMGPEVGAKDDVVVERPSLSLIDMIVNVISQRKAFPDRTVSVAIMGVIDHAVEGVVGIADHEALMPLPDAQVETVMVIVGDVVVPFAEWGIAPEVESRFEIESLGMTKC